MRRFQFHTGSIKSWNPYTIYTIPEAVSIPHWFDLKVDPAMRLKTTFEVSIPHWFD